MNKVVIALSGGVAEVMFQSDNVDVSIFDLDEENLYIYKDTYIGVVTDVNDDGTVNMSCTDEIDGSPRNKRLLHIPAELVLFYSADAGIDTDTDEEDEQ